MTGPRATYPTVTLLPRHARRVASGHPWVYSNEIRMTPEAKALPPGNLVRLVTDAGETLGIAGFNPHSLVAARLLERSGKAVIDAGFLVARIRRCLVLREKLYAAPCYRLVHAEADGLPGVIVDRFGDALAVQLNSATMELLRAALLQALDEVLAPRTIVLRNDSPVRALEGLAREVEVVRGDAAEPVTLTEDDARFLADLTGGQKTGWFFDQRDNRSFVAGLARGSRLLDLYAHSGGFALRSAVGGARQVFAVDSSADALALAERSATLNGVADRCTFVRADAFAEMERLKSTQGRFDIVVADPPAFVKTKKDLGSGSRGYRKMVRLAARLVAPGGFLFVASCSHHVSGDLFDEQVRRGLGDARRSGRVLRRAGAGPDHPVHPWLPESAYLKARVLQLD